MNWFDNMSLRAKLILNFLVSGGVLVAAIIFCIIQVKAVGRDTEEIARNWLPSVQAAAEISQLRLRYRVRSLEYLLSSSDAEREKIEKSLGDLDGKLAEALKKYEPLTSSDEERKVLQLAVKAAADYKANVLEAISLAKAGKHDEAQQLRKTTWVKAADHMRDQTDLLQKINREGSDKSAAMAASDVKAATSGGMAALVSGIVLALICTFLITARMSARLATTVDAARQIAKGDLTAQLPSGSEDEIGKLIRAMAEMQAALRTAMRETTDSARNILESSKQLNEAVSQMDTSASIQSSTASAIAANVKELTVSINIVADNTGEAARVAQDSDAQAREGHAAIEQLVQQIGEVANVVRTATDQIAKLKNDSEKISDIVSVIKDIADQTNLLALNAAIEAARAGEAGRGFAVVADEVRKLSERTAHSTGEISQMVGAIQRSTGEVVTGVGRGVELVDSSVSFAGQAGDAIARLREMAQRVAKLVGDVDGALREQSAASTEAAKKIEDIATQAEEASAIAHDTSRAAESMASTAHGMEAMVSRFRV
ncbi:MAG TPA: methyl-accepting chemotaxis protein [Accumulibacter sp.]|uniref:methyl-accepting chemotaxis protein n=2 Tax=Accumulibacter sp. TaxID=2053492 RepID=UPI0006254201|nr:methyl-accepting chemotaxis protein [Accumulibacter sp.]MCC2867303.1 methyl-accepting chemotaxis protein [Candidatus Accumulibacter phosphatis]MBN8517454.1 methyl-accepting chemotaxis protein [Accumulibacter sp.]MBO3710896.1 methyl-accepting chemotaxis protein [Accumulibacter sp.]MCQ1549547.1 methyl-accepting chemotaxis protein [Candidatus Accumulibacter phosphatis]HNC21391.1 methyl-accepting chemotaxis protein [Accumulibacter sp.]